MPVVTFWSNNEKAIGQTIATAIAATVMAMEHNYKVLLISTDFNNETLKGGFGEAESNTKIIKTLLNKKQASLNLGIDGLLKLAESNKVTPEVIRDYTKIIYNNRLEILYPPENMENEEIANFMCRIKNIILNAKRYYDYVFVDLQKGLKYKEQKEILEGSDIVVLNVEQGTKSIEKLLTLEEVKKNYNKVLWNICKYDNKSKYNSKDLTRGLLKKQKVFETYYNTFIYDACQDGMLPELLLRLRTLKQDGINKLVISRAKELTDEIILKYDELKMKK